MSNAAAADVLGSPHSSYWHALRGLAMRGYHYAKRRDDVFDALVEAGWATVVDRGEWNVEYRITPKGVERWNAIAPEVDRVTW